MNIYIASLHSHSRPCISVHEVYVFIWYKVLLPLLLVIVGLYWFLCSAARVEPWCSVLSAQTEYSWVLLRYCRRVYMSAYMCSATASHLFQYFQEFLGITFIKHGMVGVFVFLEGEWPTDLVLPDVTSSLVNRIVYLFVCLHQHAQVEMFTTVTPDINKSQLCMWFIYVI